MSDGIHELPPSPEPRKPCPYNKKIVSGWFWAHSKDGWRVVYVNSLWGCMLGNYYARTDNFDDFVGPLLEPETVSA